MNTHKIPDAAVQQSLSPAEQQQLAAAGISTALIGALIRSFISAIMANLPGILGTAGAGEASVPGTAPKK